MSSTPHRSPFPLLLAIAATLTASLLLLIATSPEADAEEVFTSQAAATHATDSTWIPAPPKRASLCLIDTGVTPNPDTTNVIARFSVDNGDPSDLSPDHHGTLMAMIASAPYNNFGMVGAAPSINIVSIRASRDGRTFGGTDLSAAVQMCLQKRHAYNIKVISLSLGGAVVTGLDSGAMSVFEDMITSASFFDVAVVAAAGNHPGAVDWPAAYEPVIAVGAADDRGGRCGFAATGPEIDLWAPGCPVDVATSAGDLAWAQGSSESTAIVAGCLTQLRGLLPEWTGASVEQLFIRAAHSGGAVPFLNVGAALVAAEHMAGVAFPPAQPPKSFRSDAGDNSSVVPTAANTLPLGPDAANVGLSRSAMVEAPENRAATHPWQLPRPVVTYKRAGSSGTLELRFKNRPAGSQVIIGIYERKRRRPFPRHREVRLTTDIARILRSTAIKQMTITYRDPSALHSRSAPRYIKF